MVIDASIPFSALLPAASNLDRLYPRILSRFRIWEQNIFAVDIHRRTSFSKVPSFRLQIEYASMGQNNLHLTRVYL